MSGCHDRADAGFAFGDCGEGDACAQDAFFEELAGEVHRELAIADDDWGDWSFAGWGRFASDVESQQA